MQEVGAVMSVTGGNETALLGSFAKKQTKYGSTCKHVLRAGKTIKHMVQPHDTLQGLALRYGVTVRSPRPTPAIRPRSPNLGFFVFRSFEQCADLPELIWESVSETARAVCGHSGAVRGWHSHHNARLQELEIGTSGDPFSSLRGAVPGN